MTDITTQDLPDAQPLAGSETVVGNQSGNTVKIPLTIITKDSLRASVEAASGGRQTVLYTAKGQPSYMYIFPRFNLEDLNMDLGTGPHPMFVVDGDVKRERFIGVYQGKYVDGEFLSLPGVDPTVSQNFDTNVSRARANGPGWGIMTNADWAGIALWCKKNGFLPRGNNNYGRDVDKKWETGRRQDMRAPGDSTGGPAARTLTGSGPASWHHDNTMSGISDLNGNIWEWAPGVRLCAGEFQVIKDNDAAMSAADFGPTSAQWMAIDGSDGSLVVPTFTGSIAGADYAPTTLNSVRIAGSGTADYTLVRGSNQSFEGITNPGGTPVGANALKVLKKLGLFPAGTELGGDNLWYALDPEHILCRGGDWTGGVPCGIFAMRMNHQRLNISQYFGSRPAFVL